MNNIQTITYAFLSFVAGVVTGYLFRGFWDKSLAGSVADYRRTVLMAGTFVWVVSVLYEIINPEYKTNPLMYALLGVIVSFFFKKKDEQE